MNEISPSDESAFEKRLAAHLRIVDSLTPPELKDPRFMKAKKINIWYSTYAASFYSIISGIEYWCTKIISWGGRNYWTKLVPNKLP